MRLTLGFHVLLLSLALIGLLLGRSVPLPLAVDHNVMATEMVNAAVHDCCDRSQPVSVDDAALAGHCDSTTCQMMAPALLPAKPQIAAAPARPVYLIATADDLDGHLPSPLLEPPRA